VTVAVVKWIVMCVCDSRCGQVDCYVCVCDSRCGQVDCYVCLWQSLWSSGLSPLEKLLEQQRSQRQSTPRW